MTLDCYLKKHGLTHTAFATRIGSTVQSVHRYVHGQRYPRPEIMRRIVEATDGAVTANDFLNAVPISPNRDSA